MLKRYNLPSVKGEGWAIIVIDTDIGFFSAVSDWGNYAYVWSHPGCEFRKFLIGLDAHYLFGKIMHGRGDRDLMDENATKKAVLEAIRECAKILGRHHPDVIHEKDLYRRTTSDTFDSREGFAMWVQESKIEEAYNCFRTMPNNDGMGFCNKVMPRFQKLLREELAAEEKEKAVAVQETEASSR